MRWRFYLRRAPAPPGLHHRRRTEADKSQQEKISTRRQNKANCDSRKHLLRSKDDLVPPTPSSCLVCIGHIWKKEKKKQTYMQISKAFSTQQYSKCCLLDEKIKKEWAGWWLVCLSVKYKLLEFRAFINTIYHKSTSQFVFLDGSKSRAWKRKHVKSVCVCLNDQLESFRTHWSEVLIIGLYSTLKSLSTSCCCKAERKEHTSIYSWMSNATAAAEVHL